MLESAQGEALATAETGKIGKTKEMKTENQEQNKNIIWDEGSTASTD